MNSFTFRVSFYGDFTPKEISDNNDALREEAMSLVDSRMSVEHLALFPDGKGGCSVIVEGKVSIMSESLEEAIDAVSVSFNDIPSIKILSMSGDLEG